MGTSMFFEKDETEPDEPNENWNQYLKRKRPHA